jgi:D-aminoacyl-tRNA deacylase
MPGYEIGQECTHHGPFCSKRAVFVEIGSSPAEWSSRKAAETIANSLASLQIEEAKVAVGIGGPHYAPHFNKLLDQGYAFGHICPKYMLQELDLHMLRQAMETSGAGLVVLDWKGLGEHKERILELLNRNRIEYIR